MADKRLLNEAATGLAHTFMLKGLLSGWARMAVGCAPASGVGVGIAGVSGHAGAPGRGRLLEL